MKLLKLTPQAYEYYKSEVRGNETTSLDQAQRKLTRNVMLVKEFHPESITKSFIKRAYQYGNLLIELRGNTIIKLFNQKGTGSHFKFDEKRYIELSKELGIK